LQREGSQVIPSVSIVEDFGAFLEVTVKNNIRGKDQGNLDKIR
jgi:hypothetical protein